LLEVIAVAGDDGVVTRQLLQESGWGGGAAPVGEQLVMMEGLVACCG